MATIDELRRLVNEPAGDSRYDDDYLESLYQENGSNLEKTAAAVWRQKAAKFAELVDMQEGDSRRNLSDMMDNALTMAKLFQDQGETGEPSGERRTTIGRITRA